MLRPSVYLLVVIYILFTGTRAQFDYGLCPDGPTPNIIDPKWHPIPSRFEVMSELVTSTEVWDLSQAFSSNRDAILTSTTKGPLELYYDYDTTELFQVINIVANQQVVQKCFREPITDNIETSVIAPKTLFVKPSILLGYDFRNRPNTAWGIRYDSDGVLRGIPTNKFKSCFYVNDTRQTVSATYHLSDPARFIAYLQVNHSILLQIEIRTTSPRGLEEKFNYNVFRLVENPSLSDERLALSTPPGVFCPDRTPTLPVPANIPETASVNTEAFLLSFNSSIISSKNFYNTDLQFTLFDFWYANPADRTSWYHLTDIHDFSVGLSYRFNYSNFRCEVSDIDQNLNDAVPTDDNPNLLQLGNPQHILLLDDMDYRYSGERRCRDRIWCHIWMGEKKLPNDIIERREWHWASRINDQPLPEWIPTKLVIKRFLSEAPIFSMELNLFNYRPSPMTIFEIDYTLANCYRALGPSANYNLAVLSFKIGNEKKYPVLQNLNYLRLHIWETLTFTMFVRPTRLSNLLVDQDGDDILVTFTLLDAPPRTGPVENPLKEDSIDTVLERFTKIIDANGLAFRARYGTKQVILRARAESLNVNHRTANIKKRSSGPKITGLWIGLIITGIVISAVGGLILHYTQTKK